MQLLYFCLLLSAVAMPILPVLLQDDFLHSVVVAILRLLPADFHHFHPDRLDPVESIVGMLILVSGFGFISKFIESRLNVALVNGVLPSEVAEAHVIQKRLLQWSWVLAAPFCLAAIGWGRMPQKLISGSDSLGWSLFIWMLPSLLMVVLIDSQSHRWRSLLIAAVASRRDDPNLESWVRTFWSHARHTWLVIFAMPLVACLTIDLATATASSWELNNSIKSVLCFAVMMPLIFVVPYAMLWCWSTEELEGIDDDLSAISLKRVAWIRELWLKHVPRSPKVLYWSTNHRLACAMVVGWLPPMRCLVLSDALLQRLNDDQLRMVILHEAAHVRRWHVWLRFIPVLVGTVGLSLWFQPNTYAFMLQNVPGYVIWMHGLATVGGILFLVRCISMIARWTELDADCVAIELGSLLKSEADRKELAQPNIFATQTNMEIISQVEKDSISLSWQVSCRRKLATDLIQALRKIVPASFHNSAGWLHPSVETRRLRIEQRYFIEPTSMVELVDAVPKSLIPSDFPSFSVPTSIPCPAGN